MKKIILLALSTIIFSFMAQSQTRIILTTGGTSMTATLTDNEATRELTELLEKGPVTINMSDYGGFEKVGALPQSFTTSNSQITTGPGDIMLYQGYNIVIFYGSNTWSYTPLGKIDGATVNELKQFLGSGSISLTLSLDSPTEMKDINTESNRKDIVYDLQGHRITNTPLSPGFYIVNGKKTRITNI